MGMSGVGAATLSHGAIPHAGRALRRTRDTPLKVQSGSVSVRQYRR